MNLKSFLIGAAAAALAAGVSAPASAQYSYAFGFSSYSSGQQTLSVSDTVAGAVTIDTNGFQGWLSDTYSNMAGPSYNTNYITGDVYGEKFNNFFVFSLAGLSGVTSATLNLYSYEITDPLTYGLYDVSTPFSTLYDASKFERCGLL